MMTQYMESVEQNWLNEMKNLERKTVNENLTI